MTVYTFKCREILKSHGTLTAQKVVHEIAELSIMGFTVRQLHVFFRSLGIAPRTINNCIDRCREVGRDSILFSPCGDLQVEYCEDTGLFIPQIWVHSVEPITVGMPVSYTLEP